MKISQVPVLVSLFLALAACSPVTPAATNNPQLVPTALVLATEIPPSSTEIPPALPTNTVTPPPPTKTAQTKTVQPTASPTEEPPSALKVAVSKLYQDALTRRSQRQLSDDDYKISVNHDLDAFLNILLHGYGDTHEPPKTEKARIASDTILSINPKTLEVFSTSFTHDIRCPECEVEKKVFGQPKSAIRLNEAYDIGKFPLLRRVFEHATGLTIDYIFVFEDSVIEQVVDKLLGGSVEVNVGRTFRVSGFYLGDTYYQPGVFEKGVNRLSGLQTVQFIKTVPEDEDPNLEHNVRKFLVFRAIAQKISASGLNLAGALDFLKGKITGETKLDLETESLPSVLHALISAKQIADANTQSGHPERYEFPDIKGQYIVDPAQDKDANLLPAAVQWVIPNAAVKDPQTGVRYNPDTWDDITRGIYGIPEPGQPFDNLTIDMEVPVSSSTKCSNFALCYWTSVRNRVAVFLLGK